MPSCKMAYMRLCLLKCSSAISKLFKHHHALVKKKKRHENYKKGKHFANNNNNKNNRKKIIYGVFYICAMTS